MEIDSDHYRPTNLVDFSNELIVYQYECQDLEDPENEAKNLAYDTLSGSKPSFYLDGLSEK